MATKRLIRDLDDGTPLSALTFDASGRPRYTLTSELVSGDIDLFTDYISTGLLKTDLQPNEIINTGILNDPSVNFNHKGIYQVDLDFWGINDLTTPLETTQRLNNIFIWAAKCPGLTDIVFPLGEIFTVDVEQDTVISRNSNAFYSFLEYPQYYAIVIQNLRNVNINWNSSTIKMVGNPYTRYQNIYILDCSDMIMSNGIVFGERLEHDYLTNPVAGADHEHGHGILGEGVNENITFTNMTIRSVMGYGLAFYITEPYINSLFRTSIDLEDIEQGAINTFGLDETDATINAKYTRTIMKDLPVGYYPLRDLTLTGLGFFSADGIVDNCVITVFWYDENDNLIYSVTGDEGSNIEKPLNARKYRLDFKQPLQTTKWFEGAISDVDGSDILIPSELLGETAGTVLTPAEIKERNNSTGRYYGRTELTSFTEKENTHNLDDAGVRYFRPQRFYEITMFNYGKFTGITVYFYDASDNFISSTPYTEDAIAIPANATQWRMFGRSTPYNERASRFLIFLTAVGYCKNIRVDNCLFLENRSMGGAGIYNGLIVENSAFIRNGATIQGNDKSISLGYGWDLEEGHKMNKNVIFRNNRFIENFEGALLFFPLDDLTIINNYFDDRKVVIYNKINRAIIENNTFVNCDKGDIRGDFNNVNATLINCRVDALYGNLINPKMIDCTIIGGTAANDFDAESLEEITIEGGSATFTENYNSNSFIETYAKTVVTLNNFKINNEEAGNINLINSSQSGIVFRNSTAIGLILNNCTVNNMVMPPNAKIYSIKNSTLDLKLAFNAAILDSPIDFYKGITLNSNDITLRPVLGAFAKLSFDLDVDSMNNRFTSIGSPQSGFYMLDFEQGLETRQDVFKFPSTVAASVFRTIGDTKILRSEVRSENPSALIQIGGTVEEFQPLYSPAKQ